MGPMDLPLDDFEEDMVPDEIELQGWFDEYQEEWGDLPNYKEIPSRFDAFLDAVHLDRTDNYTLYDDRFEKSLRMATPKAPIGRQHEEGTDPYAWLDEDPPGTLPWFVRTEAINDLHRAIASSELSRGRIEDLLEKHRTRASRPEWAEANSAQKIQGLLVGIVNELTNDDTEIVMLLMRPSSVLQGLNSPGPTSPAARAWTVRASAVIPGTREHPDGGRDNSDAPFTRVVVSYPREKNGVMRRPLWFAVHGDPSLTDFSNIKRIKNDLLDSESGWVQAREDGERVGTFSVRRGGGGSDDPPGSATEPPDCVVGISDEGPMEAVRASGAAIDPEEIEAHNARVIRQDKERSSREWDAHGGELLYDEDVIRSRQDAFLEATR